MASYVNLTDSGGGAVRATERSTLAIDLAFADEDGAAVTPSAATWTLTTMDGEVVNSREDVAISPLGAAVTIVLQGDDLAVAGTAPVWRLVTVEATYTSDLGSGLPLKQAIRFPVDPLVGVEA